jgi:hypothetical protein
MLYILPSPLLSTVIYNQLKRKIELKTNSLKTKNNKNKVPRDLFSLLQSAVYLPKIKANPI